MSNMYERTEMLIGAENVLKLKKSHVAVFGVGGVGSYICEALARAGVGTLTIVDYDKITPSNINRQLHALNSTIGAYKTDAMKARILDINPKAAVNAKRLFYLPGESGAEESLDWQYDYVADAVDNVTGKIHIITTAKERGINVISSMGTGNKLDLSRFSVADIYDTSVCPLAKVMRKELRKRGVEELKVVFSDETPIKPVITEYSERIPPASISFVPSYVGLIIASEIIKDICFKNIM